MSSYHDFASDGIASSPGMNNSYTSAMSIGTPSASSASSSKAVLAALRALQDKIRRLETERSQAMDETAQLRSQLKNQEIEATHFREKEKYASDKAAQEARTNYEKLRQEKLDAETRLVRLEEKNKESERQQDELSRRIQELEEEKARALMRQNELASNSTHLDNQLEQALHRENDLSQTLLWETKRHEDEVAQLNQRVNTLRAEIAEASAEKANSGTTLAELDQLVGQLLSVNESLVAKLSGKPMPTHTSTLGMKKAVSMRKGGKSVQYKDVLNATTAASNLLLPRAAYAATAASTASRAATPRLYGRAGQLAEQKNAEIEHLTSLHNMFSKLAKGITKKRLVKPKAAGTKTAAAAEGKKSAATKSTTSVKKTTRIGAKKATAAAAKSSVSMDDSYLNSSNATSSSVNRLSSSAGATAVSGGIGGVSATSRRKSTTDSSSISARNVYIPTASMHVGSPATDTDSSPTCAVRKSATGGSGIGKGNSKIITSKNSNADDLTAVIASLEDEFDSLNNQYSYLLSSVKQPGGGQGGVNSSIDSTGSSGSANADTAEELVDVIQKLHRKGEQLRQLRSPGNYT